MVSRPPTPGPVSSLSKQTHIEPMCSLSTQTPVALICNLSAQDTFLSFATIVDSLSALGRNIAASARCGGVPGILALRLAVLLALACSGLLGPPLVCGQDDWDAVEAEPPLPGAMVVAAPQFNLHVERWFFGQKSRVQVEQSLMSRADLQLDCLESACDLSDAQRTKLQLAARGDVKRFFGRFDEIRERFGDLANDQQKLNELMQAIQPLRTKMSSSFFDENSLFHKVLLRTLDPEQSRKYQEQQHERRRFQYQAKIELALAVMENSVPLRQQQRQQFLTLLLDETEPPAAFGQKTLYEVFYQAGKLDEARLKPIFDDAQWRSIRQMLAQSKRMEASLKTSGFVP